MKLKFGGQLIEPAVSPSSGIGEAKTDVPADRGAVPPGVLRHQRGTRGSFKNSTLGNVRSDLTGCPTRTHQCTSALVSRDEMILREPLVERNLPQIRLNFVCFCPTQNGQDKAILS
jgi:hypothetical protein